MIAKVVASEIARAQTISRNTYGVSDLESSKSECRRIGLKSPAREGKSPVTETRVKRNRIPE